MKKAMAPLRIASFSAQSSSFGYQAMAETI
jgi:hypothetical protein